MNTPPNGTPLAPAADGLSTGGETVNGATVDDAGAATLGPGKEPTVRRTSADAPSAALTTSGPLSTSVATTVRGVLRNRPARDRPARDSGGLNRYVTVRELGRGGMGKVVEAIDGVLGRRVAVKTLLADNEAIRKRFDLEALVTAQLDHPGIPALYEMHHDANGSPCYTMRLVQGDSLAQVLRDAPSYEARLRWLPAVVQVAQTLAFAHERGVVHRDIKPDNVIVGKHGEVALLDWGIAKVRGLADTATGPDSDAQDFEDAALTSHGSILGTPAYMAPEQARGEVAHIDERTDVFALGAMLFHVLVGHAPYRGAGLTDLLHQARLGQPPAIDKEAPHAPAALRAVVARAMQAQPELRHPTAVAFAADIETALAAAVARPQSAGVARFAAATGWFGLVVCILMAAVGWAATPTLREMGVAAIGTVVFFVVGLAVALVEWSTVGRYALQPLGLALAATTAISAISGAVTGLLNVYGALGREDIAANAAKFRELAAIGHYEALGNIPFGLGFALLQCFALALAWRRTTLARSGQS